MHSHPHTCYVCTGTWWTSLVERGAAIRYLKGENFLFPFWLTSWKTYSEKQRGLICGQSSVKCSEIILGVLGYDREQSQASGLQRSAHVIAFGNCMWLPSWWRTTIQQGRKATPEEEARGRSRGEGRAVIVRCKKKIKSKEAPRGALIVVEDNGSEQKRKGCEEAEYPGETQVSEISHHFCVWCFPYSSKKMTHLTTVL